MGPGHAEGTVVTGLLSCVTMLSDAAFRFRRGAEGREWARRGQGQRIQCFVASVFVAIKQQLFGLSGDVVCMVCTLNRTGLRTHIGMHSATMVANASNVHGCAAEDGIILAF